MFTQEELLIIMEAARIGLNDADNYTDLAEQLDLSDKELSNLRTKLQNHLDTDYTEEVLEISEMMANNNISSGDLDDLIHEINSLEATTLNNSLDLHGKLKYACEHLGTTEVEDWLGQNFQIIK